MEAEAEGEEVGDEQTIVAAEEEVVKVKDVGEVEVDKVSFGGLFHPFKTLEEIFPSIAIDTFVLRDQEGDGEELIFHHKFPDRDLPVVSIWGWPSPKFCSRHSLTKLGFLT